MTELVARVSGVFVGPKKLDRVWLSTALVLIAISLFDLAQGKTSFFFVIENLLAIAPFLVAAIAFAAYAKATGADSLIAKAFQGQIAVMIVVSAIFGGLSPFCSCGVIPLIAALLSMGVPLPAVMAFWLASPIMDPSMFILTTATLGLPFAIGKTAAALGIGMLGGFTTLALQNRGLFADPLLPGVGDGGCGGSKARNGVNINWKFWQEGPRREAFTKEGISSTLFLGKWMAFAFVLESLMIAYVPADMIAQVLGKGSAMAIPVATLVGVPAYLNGYAALPLMAGLIDMGVTQGAAMAFLVAGGVTSIPAAIAVFALVKKPVFVWYVVLSLTGGMMAGLLYETALLLI